MENDPVGSVSIFKRKKSTETYREACEVGFEEFDTPTKRKKLVKSGVRVSGANFTTPSMVRLKRSCVLRDVFLQLLLLLLP